MNFKNLSLEEIIDLIKSKKATKEEVWNYFQKRIEKYDDKLQAFNFVNKD
jgi:Asp-tRNA(Asn)/Glu-tRNA(Gln) amidotransferase A subunit family amidase